MHHLLVVLNQDIPPTFIDFEDPTESTLEKLERFHGQTIGSFHQEVNATFLYEIQKMIRYPRSDASYFDRLASSWSIKEKAGGLVDGLYVITFV